MKTKEDWIEDAGRAETAGILRPQRTGPQNDNSRRERLEPNRRHLDIATILFLRNELKDLLKTNDLAFFEAKNELVFECKRTQIEAKK